MTACDQTFEPFEAHELNYSLVGYLDAAADTQWVRVMPIRTAAGYRDRDPLDATVTVQRLDDAGTVTLKDSVFVYPPAVFLGNPDTVYAHNFWRPFRVEPGARYRLDVERSDGAASSATLAIPEDYDVTVEYVHVNLGIVEVRTEYLGIVAIRFRTGEDCKSHPYHYDYFPGVPPPVNGVYRVELAWNTGAPCSPTSKDLFVVVADREWPSGPADAAWAFTNLARPTTFSNAEGFVAGVYTKKVPWEPCVLEPAVGRCRLTFTSRSVSVRGLVRDAGCPDQPPIQASVRLTELPADGGPRRVRDKFGSSYRFDVIDPGTRYVLRASSSEFFPGPPVRPVYGVVEDTVSVPAGEVLVHDILLPRLIPC